MDHAVRVLYPPACLFQEAPGLKKKLDAIVWLIRPAIGVAKFGIDLVKPHQVEIVRSGEEKSSTRPGNTVKLAHAFFRLWQVFYGFAGDDQVEAVIGKW